MQQVGFCYKRSLRETGRIGTSLGREHLPFALPACDGDSLGRAPGASEAGE